MSIFDFFRRKKPISSAKLAGTDMQPWIIMDELLDRMDGLDAKSSTARGQVTTHDYMAPAPERDDRHD